MINVYTRFRLLLFIFVCGFRLCAYRPRSIEAISNGTIPRNGRNGGPTTNGISNGGGINGVLNGGGHLNGGNCVTRGAGGLHEDADFPPNPKTLSRRKPIVWMRPHVSSILSIKDLVYNLCLKIKYVFCVLMGKTQISSSPSHMSYAKMM